MGRDMQWRNFLGHCVSSLAGLQADSHCEQNVNAVSWSDLSRSSTLCPWFQKNKLNLKTKLLFFGTKTYHMLTLQDVFWELQLFATIYGQRIGTYGKYRKTDKVIYFSFSFWFSLGRLYMNMPFDQPDQTGTSVKG